MWPDCVRIHLIPPKKLKLGVPWIVIIKGYSILPLLTSWALLLKSLILNLNKTQGKPLDKSEIDELVNLKISYMSNIYKNTDKVLFRSDLKEIVETLTDIVQGKESTSKIGYMTIESFQALDFIVIIFSVMEDYIVVENIT